MFGPFSTARVAVHFLLHVSQSLKRCLCRPFMTTRGDGGNDCFSEHPSPASAASSGPRHISQESLDRYNTLDIDWVFSLDHSLMGQDTCACCTLAERVVHRWYQTSLSVPGHTHTHTKKNKCSILSSWSFSLSSRCTKQAIH